MPTIKKDFIPKKLNYFKDGDIFLADTSEDRKDCGKPLEIDNENNFKIVGGLHTIHVTDKSNLCIPHFKAYSLQTPRYHKFTYCFAEGIKVFSLKPSLFKYFTFYYPQSKIEQSKIVKLIDNLDHKIEILMMKLDTLKKYKEGLVDKLLISKGNDYIFLKDLIKIMPKGNLGAKMGIINGSYPFYLSGDNTSRLNSFMINGTYIIANDGGEAGFRLTKGKFSYSDHCICFKGDNDIVTVNLFNYLNSIKRQITYKGFTGSGLKNIDRQYFFKLKIPQKIRDVQLAKVFQLVQTYIDNLEQEVKLAHLLKTNILNNMFI